MTREIVLPVGSAVSLVNLRALNNAGGGGYCIVRFDPSIEDQIRQLSGFIPSHDYVSDQHLHEAEIGYCQAFHFVKNETP